MLFLDGKKISQLERKKSLDAADSFLISRNYNISTDNQFSKQVSFDTLAQDIEEKLDGNIMVSSMVYRETYEYARKNHGHDYSNVRVYVRPDSFLKRFAKTTAKIAEITAYNEGKEETFEIKIPDQKYHAKKYQPKIGELKFFATNTIPYIDIDSSNFDGWVYPDGSTYDKDRFPEAWKVYSTSQDSNTFQVPFLSTFFKPNPFPYRENSLSATPGNTSGIPAHKHDTDGDGLKFKDADIETKVDIPGNEDCDGSADGTKSIHARGTAMPLNSMVKDKLQESEYTLSIKKIKMAAYGGKLQVAGDSTKTCPSFNLLPVKIFIGGAKNDL